jgi:hypothetical protein
MEANLKFANVTAYNVVKFDVRLGETFDIELVNVDRTMRWFSDNDQVLSVAVQDGGESAKVTSTAKGRCDIQLQSNGEIIMVLQAEVYDNVAVALNPEARTPILK